jgi:hypothetical protein
LRRSQAHDGTLAFYNLSGDLKEVEATQMVEEVKASYPSICPLDINLVMETKYVSSTWTASTQSEYDMAPFVLALRQSLCELKGFFTQHAKQLRKQHGGIQNHKSLGEPMTKIGDTVDKTVLIALSSQVFAIHGEQLATANARGCGYINELIAAIDGALDRDQTL